MLFAEARRKARLSPFCGWPRTAPAGGASLHRTVLTRRSILKAGSAFVVFNGCQLQLEIPPDATYDEVLDLLNTTDFEFGQGLSNHGPMVAETFLAMGRPDRVAPYMKGYVGQLRTRNEGKPLAESEQAAALGDIEKREEWAATYERDLETMSPEALIQREFPKLALGWGIFGMHGLIRTAHAYRGLLRQDTPARRKELAQGLGYWAARHELLPGTPGAQPQAGLDVLTALQQVQPIPASEQLHGGLIGPRMAKLKGNSAFAATVESVDLNTGTPERLLGDVIGAATRLLVNVKPKDIALLHGVTGSAALRILFPVLDASNQRLAVGAAFQVVAALFAAQCSAPEQFDPVADPSGTADSLLAAAAEMRDEHAIKLTETCVREFRVTGKPELLRAAELYVA